MTQEEYIKDRLDDQINWYEKKSSFCQKKHKFWQVMKIVSALSITTISLWAPADLFKSPVEGSTFSINLSHLIGVIGAFIVFIESFVKIFDYEKLWIQYRSTAERLKREKLLFQTSSKPYHTKEAFSLLVQQSESIMNNEVQGWVELVNEKEDKK